MLVESIELHCTEGRSDKVYNVQLCEVMPGMYEVEFQYGRRGSTLKGGKKTSKPVSMGSARVVYDKLVAEKTAKGYRTIGHSSGSGFAPVPPSAPKVPGLECQLMNPISDELLEALLQDDDWGVQEKMDGERLMVAIRDEVIGANRKGLRKALPADLVVELSKLPQNTTLDGEQIGSDFYVFDILELDGRALNEVALSARYAALKSLMGKLETERIHLVTLATVELAKRAVVKRVQDRSGEGVALKLLSSTYQPGRPSSGGDWMKFKFVQDASCIVLGHNEDVRSIRLGMYEAGTVVEVGNVTIPPNKSVPEVGAIVDVRYLYAYKGGSLYQPVYKGPREDLERAAAVTTQLKYKPESEKLAA